MHVQVRPGEAGHTFTYAEQTWHLPLVARDESSGWILTIRSRTFVTLPGGYREGLKINLSLMARLKGESGPVDMPLRGEISVCSGLVPFSSQNSGYDAQSTYLVGRFAVHCEPSL